MYAMYICYVMLFHSDVDKCV